MLTMSGGAASEIVVVGSEGMIGLEAAFGVRRAMCDAAVQVAGDGTAHAMNVEAFRREMDLRRRLIRERDGVQARVAGFHHAVRCL